VATKKIYTQDQIDFVKMSGKVDNIEKAVMEIDKKLDSNYVTKDELKLVQMQVELLQRIVYGVVGLILTAVVGGMVAFYINR